MLTPPPPICPLPETSNRRCSMVGNERAWSMVAGSRLRGLSVPESLRLKLRMAAGSTADMGVWGTLPDCHSVSTPAPFRSASRQKRLRHLHHPFAPPHSCCRPVETLADKRTALWFLIRSKSYSCWRGEGT